MACSYGSKPYKPLPTALALFYLFTFLPLNEPKDALRPFVEQQVEDAEVGKEAMTLSTNLIIRTSLKLGIRQRMLGTYGIAIIYK